MGRDSASNLRIWITVIALILVTIFFLSRRMSKKMDTSSSEERVSAQTVTLAWDPPLVTPAPSLTGYWLRYGVQQGTYTQVEDVGNVLQATVSSLQDQTQYFFVATAHNAAGQESPASNEVFAGATPSSPTPGPSPTGTPPQVIVLNPTSITFNYVTGGPSPAPQTLQATTTNNVSWNNFDTSPWFDTTPTFGASGASATLKPNMAGITGLAPGNYYQNLKYMASGCPDKIIAVKLVVSATAPTPMPTRPHPVDTVPPGPTSHPELTVHP